MSVTVTPSASYTVAAESIGSAAYQLVKLVGGQAGSTEQIPGDATLGLGVQVLNVPQVAVSSMPAITGVVTVANTVNVSGVVAGVTTQSSATGAAVWLAPAQSLGVVSTIAAVLGSVLVSGTLSVNTAGTVAGASVTIQQGASVSLPAVSGVVATSAPVATSQFGTPVWVAGGQSQAALPVFVSQINPPAAGGGSVTTAGPSISATGQVVWIAGGQSSATANPIWITGTVAAGAGTTVVSIQGIVPVTTAASVSVSGLPVWWNPTAQVVVSGFQGQSVSALVSISAMPGVSIVGIVPVTTAASVSVTGLPVWFNPTAQVVVSGLVGHSITGSVNIVSVAVVSVSAVVPVTTQASVSVSGLPVWWNPTAQVVVSGFQGQSVSALVSVSVMPSVAISSNFITTAGPGAAQTGIVAWIANPTTVTVTIAGTTTGTISISGVVPVTTAASVSVTGLPVWLNPTQTVAVSGAIAGVTTQTAVTGAGVWLALTQQLTATIATNVIVTTAIGTPNVSGVAIYNADLDITTAQPGAGVTGQIAYIAGVASLPPRIGFMAMVASTPAISAGTSLLFTVWTGSTLAGAGLTQYPVPAGKAVRINAIYGVLGSSASTGRSCQLLIQAGASGSMTSANVATCGQVAALQMQNSAVQTYASIIGLGGYIGGGQTMGIFFTMASSITVSQFLIQGYLEG